MENTYGKQFNRHHVFYAGREYRKHHLLRNLREHPGMVIPMNIQDHQNLHQDLWISVPKPDLDAVHALLYGDILLPYDPNQPRLLHVQQAIGFFAMTGNELTAEHLQSQVEYILRTPLPDGGRYEAA